MKPLVVSQKIWILLLAGLLAFAVWFFGYFIPAGQKLEFTGLVQASEVKNASRFGGRVIQVLVKEGDKVTAGQPLIVFDDVDLKSQIAQAEAGLTEASARENLLRKGASAADVKQAMAKLQQTRENLSILQQGARPDQLAQASANLTTARAQVELSKNAFDNAKHLLDEGVISQQKHDELRASVERSQAQFESAQATWTTVQKGARPEEIRAAQSQMVAANAGYQQVKSGAKPDEIRIASAMVSQAKSALEAIKSRTQETTLKAPMDGVVSLISVTQGELVQPGRPVVTIINPETLWTDIYLPESLLLQVKEGQTVSVVASVIPKTSFEGTINVISPKSEFVPGSDGAQNDSEESSFKVKILLKKTDRSGQFQLRPGMNISVRFTPKKQ